MRAGHLPARRKGGRGAKGRDLGGHAPRCYSVSDWTRESSHLGFEAGGGKGEEPAHAPHPSVAADWPAESPRSVLEGSLWSSPQGSPEDWLFQGAPWAAVVTEVAGHGGQVRRSATRLSVGAGGRASRENWGAAGPEPQVHLGPVVRSATSKSRGPTCAGVVAV